MNILSKIKNRFLQRRLNRMCASGTAVMHDVGNKQLPRKALLHYTIDSFVCPAFRSNFSRPALWDSAEIVNILNSQGFSVDVVDRSNRTWMPDDSYDLLISNASGNSGQMYPVYADKMPSAAKIFYALGPEVGEANQKVQDRYDFLSERYDVEYPTMRIMDKVDIKRCMALSDALVVFEDNGYSTGSYSAYDIPKFGVSPSSSPHIKFDASSVNTRERNTFLAFVGNGFIAKGIDILVEVFEQLPDCKLIIAGPDSDKAFWDLYGDRVEKADNISYIGFLEVAGETFNKLAAQCSYVIAPVASEGVCTSVTTCMRAGLVPIVPFESGVDVSSINRYLSSDLKALHGDLKDMIAESANCDDTLYRKQVEATLLKARDFSQSSFSYSWSKTLSQVLQVTNKTFV